MYLRHRRRPALRISELGLRQATQLIGAGSPQATALKAIKNRGTSVIKSAHASDQLLTIERANDCMDLLYRQMSGAMTQAAAYAPPLRSVYPLPSQSGRGQFLGLMPSIMTTADATETLYFGTKVLSVF